MECSKSEADIEDVPVTSKDPSDGVVTRIWKNRKDMNEPSSSKEHDESNSSTLLNSPAPLKVLAWSKLSNGEVVSEEGDEENMIASLQEDICTISNASLSNTDNGAIIIGNSNLVHKVKKSFVDIVAPVISEVNGVRFAVMCPICESVRCHGPNDHKMEVVLDTRNLMPNLPIEIVINVMEYLSPQELVKYVTRVNKSWRCVAYTPMLWKSLDLHGRSDIPTSTLNYLLKQTHGVVETLRIHGRRLSMLDSQVWSGLCKNLTNLDLSFSKNISTDIMKIIWKNCPLITSLNLQGFKNIEMEVMEVICRWRLTDLNLYYCEYTKYEVINYMLTTLQGLVSLNISGIHDSKEDCIVMCLANKHHSTLKYLDLDGEELTEDGFHHLAICNNLIRLTIHYCHSLSDRVLPCILDLTSLQHLKLRDGKNLTANGISKLFQGPELHNLKVLDLSECSCITDDVIKLIVTCCGSNLRELNLSWAYLTTDVGCDYIIYSCRNLEKLYFIGNKLIDGRNMLDISTYMPRLIILDLEMCDGINDDMMVELVFEKHDLVVTNYYGEKLQYSRST